MKIIMEAKITAQLARDINGNLSLIPDSRAPLKKTKIERLPRFQPYEGSYLDLDNNLFPQVKWEDKEPTKVELTIKICD